MNIEGVMVSDLMCCTISQTQIVFNCYQTQHFAADLVLFCRNPIVTNNRKVTINHCATGGIIQNH